MSKEEDNQEQTIELKVTKDGSHTLYSRQFDQFYHNPNGAVSESRHLFFETNRLIRALRDNNNINILEIGFGTGLNLLLLLDYHRSLNSDSRINYTSVEAYPISGKQARSFNFGKYIDYPPFFDKVIGLFSDLGKGNNSMKLTNQITVNIFNGLFKEFNPTDIEADFIFHDAFSPDVNPDLWTADVFKKLNSLSSEDVLLTTYCAASKARGAMAFSGWHIARAKGALGKREMTIASLNPDMLTEFERVNEDRLANRYREDDF